MADQPGSILTAEGTGGAADPGTGGTAAGAEGTKTPEQIAAENAAKGTEGTESGKTGTEGTEKKEGDGEKKAANEFHGAPEKYEDLAMPEGMEVDKAALEKFTPVARELNLSQKGLQKLADFHAQGVKATQEANAKAWADTVAGWRKEAQDDSEIGGKEYNAHVADAKTALDKLGTQKLREYLDTYQAGSHPEVIRFMAKVGKMLKNATTHHGAPGGGTGEPSQQDVANAVYPTMATK